MSANVQDVLDIVTPVLTPPMAGLIAAAYAVADGDAGIDALRRACDQLNDAISTAPDIFYATERMRADNVIAERARTIGKLRPTCKDDGVQRGWDACRARILGEPHP